MQEKNVAAEMAFFEKKMQVKDYFANLDYSGQEGEIVEIIDYFRKYNFSVSPYEFVRNYHNNDVDIFYDNSNRTRYVLHKNKRLYFPNEWSIDQVQTYYNDLCIEQDKASPHRYETEEFMVEDGEVIVDIGSAEGIWALENVEKASKVYLFECDPLWINALAKTFAPWKDKVVIINKYVSDTSNKKFIALDNFFEGQQINFIKADIEGMELKMLEGSKKLLQRNDSLRMLLCAYHQEDDASNLKEFLEKNGFATEYSKGYMLFIYDANFKEPYIRRGLLRAKK